MFCHTINGEVCHILNSSIADAGGGDGDSDDGEAAAEAAPGAKVHQSYACVSS